MNQGTVGNTETPQFPSGGGATRSFMPQPNAGARHMPISAVLAPALFLAAYLFLWNHPKIKLIDPWYYAFYQVSAGLNARNTPAGRAMLDKGGDALRSLRATYPFHARIHFMLGYYYENTGSYDSAIIEARRAIRLGSGSVVNRVDDLAADLLKASIAKKDSLQALQRGVK